MRQRFAYQAQLYFAFTFAMFYVYRFQQIYVHIGIHYIYTYVLPLTGLE